MYLIDDPMDYFVFIDLLSSTLLVLTVSGVGSNSTYKDARKVDSGGDGVHGVSSLKTYTRTL